MPDGSLFKGRVDSAEGKRAWVTGAPKIALLDATPRGQEQMLAALSHAAGCSLPSDLSSQLYLRPNDWRSLVDAGMRVGAHSVSHPRLTRLTDAELDSEVGGSIDIISALNPRISFAYPDGVFDDRVVQHLRHQGVASAVTCEREAVGACDVLRLPRRFVSPDFGTLS